MDDKTLYLVTWVVTLSATLVCGWFGVTAFRQGRRVIGASILAAPFLLTVGPALAAFLPVVWDGSSSLIWQHMPSFESIALVAVALIAFVLHRRHLSVEKGSHA